MCYSGIERHLKIRRGQSHKNRYLYTHLCVWNHPGPQMLAFSQEKMIQKTMAKNSNTPANEPSQSYKVSPGSHSTELLMDSTQTYLHVSVVSRSMYCSNWTNH